MTADTNDVLQVIGLEPGNLSTGHSLSKIKLRTGNCWNGCYERWDFRCVWQTMAARESRLLRCGGPISSGWTFAFR